MAWFVKIEQGIVDKAVFDQYIPAHKAFVQKLIDQGRQARTGYWAQRGGGMLLFQAKSMEEARHIIEQDPLIINRCVNYQLYEWKIVLGEAETFCATESGLAQQSLSQQILSEANS